MTMAGYLRRMCSNRLTGRRFTRWSFRRFLSFPALAIVIAVGCTGLSSDWDGTWRLVPSKSEIPRSNFQITLSEAGDYVLDYGTHKDRFRCDGRDYQLSSGKTISCNQTGAFAFDSTARKDGNVLNTAHWELSADQEMLSIKMAAPPSRGVAPSKEIVYKRTAGIMGFAGTWRDVNHLGNRPQLLLLTVRGQHLHYGFPEVGQYAEVEMGGADAPWHGPSIPVGSTIAIRTQDRSELLTLRKLDGRILNQGSMKISPDGHTLTEVFWSPDRPDLKSILVYEKQ